MSTVIVFCKSPRPGDVKTRLCPPLSPGEAADLARAFVQDLVASLATLDGCRLEIALPPRDRPSDFAFLDHDLPFVAQGHGDLGRRLARATESAWERRREAVVVVGSDHPNLPLDFVRGMVEIAQEGQVGWIPTDDGGFAAMALPRPTPALFDDVPWSSSGVAAAMRGNARRHGIELVDRGTWYDIDDGRDLLRLARELETSSDCPATRRVLASLRPPLPERNADIPQGEPR